MATTNERGCKYTVKVGGTAIGAELDGTLQWQQDQERVTDAASCGWATFSNGVLGWTIQSAFKALESSSRIDPADATNPATVSVGGTDVQKLLSANLSITTEFADAAGTSDGRFNVPVPMARVATLDMEAIYQQPLADASAEAMEDILQAADNTSTSSLTMVLNVGVTQSFSFSANPTGVTFVRSIEDLVHWRAQFQVTGAITAVTTNLDTAQAAIVTSLLASDIDNVSALTMLVTTGTTPNTEFTGTAYPSQLGVSVARGSKVEYSYTVTGTGALTTQATS